MARCSERTAAGETAARILLLLLAAAAAARLTAEPVPPAQRPPVRVFRSGGLRAESAALLVSGQEGGEIPLAVLALPFPPAAAGSDARAAVPVIVEVDGPALLAGQGGDLLRFEVCLYALAAPGAGDGRLASQLTTIEVDLADLRPRIAGSGIRFAGELALPAGAYSLRVLVRNPATGTVGLRSLPLAVPAAADGALLPPLFPAAEAWLPVRAAAEAASQPLPFAELPAARPFLAAGREAAFELPAYRLAAGARLRVEVRRPGAGAAGEPAAELPARVVGRRPAGPELEILSAVFAPRGLAPGEYELRAVAEDAAGGAPLRSPLLPFSIAGGPPDSTAAAPPAGRPPRLPAREVAAAYRAVLAQLAAGEEGAAGAALFAFESPLLGARSELQEVELGVAKELGRRRPESLVPILLLHTRAYRDDLERRLLLPSIHAGELVSRLADLYVELAARGPRSDSADGARRLAAAFLVGLTPGGAASRGGANVAALRQALVLDPGNEAALLCLAVHAEWNADYAEAADLLTLLLRDHPGNREARLRAAVDLGRLGRRDEARRRLTAFLAEPPAGHAEDDDWLSSLAAQELVRARLEDGDAAGAGRAAREGLGRRPADEQLSLLAALALDLEQRPAEARAALEGAARTPAADGPTSPRYRFRQLPAEALKRVFRELEARAAERRPELAAALAAAGGSR